MHEDEALSGFHEFSNHCPTYHSRSDQKRIVAWRMAEKARHLRDTNEQWILPNYKDIESEHAVAIYHV